MVNTFTFVTAALAATATIASGASMRAEAARAWPASQGDEFFDEPYVVKKGEVYDGKMKTFQRSNVKCAGQRESGWQTAVFRVEPGGTLKNVIIGQDQMEGVHCEQSGCTIENVDKVIQHNGYGTVSIEGFYVEDFGKLYRSCGTCGYKGLKVNVKNVYAVDGRVSVVTVNENWGDQATLENIKIKGKKINVCSWSDGTTSGGEPEEAGAGPKGNVCKYSPSTITYV
ncbi:Pectate lyase [Phytophthora infestans]|uniref:Probable pectate lyase F n=1 Tax=Phytophthora infestans TaxID=4787 RepID=A0A833SD23_PHYIN|nr:Pectate lyase [Phytophthora infestans]